MQDKEIKEITLALLSTNQSMTKVKQILKQQHKVDIPLSTISTWKHLAEEDEVFVETRNKNKVKFVESAWDIITKSNELLKRRLDRALDNEGKIDELLRELVAEAPTKEARERIYSKFEKLRFDNISALSSLIGVLYDKQALINNEKTANVNLTFEEYIKKCEGKNEY